MSHDLSRDPRVEEILDVFASGAHIQRHRVTADARADELGLTSLDFALALFEVEDRFDIVLPESPPNGSLPTLRELLLQVLDGVDRRRMPPGAD